MSSECDRSKIEGWTVRELKQWLLDHSLSAAGLTEKSELVDLVCTNYARSTPAAAAAAPLPDEEVFATPADLAKGNIDMASLLKAFAAAKRDAPPPPPRTPGLDVGVESVRNAATGANNVQIVCRQCGCHLLKAGKGVHVVHPITVPHPDGSSDDLIIEHQWRVGNMYDFDNLGFCRSETPSSATKFLTCADCEREIIGIHYLAAHEVFPGLCFLSHDRVAYLDG